MFGSPSSNGLFLGLFAFTATLGGCSDREPILNRKPDIEFCRAQPTAKTLTFDGWEPNAPKLEVRFQPSAPTPCPARRFPFIDVAASSPVRFIQVVTVNVPIPMGQDKKPARSWQLSPADEPWIFADMTPERRDTGEPFLNAGTDGKFWDNPAWPEPPKSDQKDGVRKWQSRSYAVIADGKNVRAVGGFSWGWSWKVGAADPEAITPERLQKKDWDEDALRLKTAFDGWKFE
ncbi:MAG: hypothetical protein IPK82_03570 [Polyangiaceae bacterium]|nr:hypothetical protein [Polyangiaceae bacterium]